MDINKEDLLKETRFRATRSGGKGGQNVNKVSTRIELIFDAASSELLTSDDKILLLQKLASRLNRDGAIHVVCDTERSQFLNREKALERLHHIIVKAFEKPKPRKPTKLSKAAKAKRAVQKQLHSGKKANRRRNFED